MAGRALAEAPPKHVTAPKAAKRLGVTSQTIRNWVKSGYLDGTREQLVSGEPRYFVEIASLEEALARNGVSPLSSVNQEVAEDQELAEDELATRLDAFEKRVLDILEPLARQEQTEVPHEEVSALREQLRAEQTARREAEIERDLLRNMLSHTAHQAALQSFETPIEPTTASKNVSTENSEAGKQQGTRRLDGDKIKSLRQAEWLSQQELAEIAGVNAITLSRIERGKNANPRHRTILGIANGLRVELDELFTYS